MGEYLKEVGKKAYEIAYALGRVANAAGGPFGDALARRGVELLDAALGGNGGELTRLIMAADYFVKLGAGLGSISQANADLLIEQLNMLNVMEVPEEPTEKIVKKSLLDVDLSDIFSDGFGNTFTRPEEISRAPKKGNEIPTFLKSLRGSGDEMDEDQGFAGYPAMEIKTDAEDTEEPIGANKEAFSPISSSIRQSSILNMVRKSGNCRIKDLQEMFSQYSERTIRYDLESLIQKKLIERVGAGSATAYRPLTSGI